MILCSITLNKKKNLRQNIQLKQMIVSHSYIKIIPGALDLCMICTFSSILHHTLLAPKQLHQNFTKILLFLINFNMVVLQSICIIMCTFLNFYRHCTLSFGGGCIHLYFLLRGLWSLDCYYFCLFYIKFGK